jgi:hypothetical protein
MRRQQMRGPHAEYWRSERIVGHSEVIRVDALPAIGAREILPRVQNP